MINLHAHPTAAKRIENLFTAKRNREFGVVLGQILIKTNIVLYVYEAKQPR